MPEAEKQTQFDLAQWARQWPWTPLEVDCITTIMLKILDGKCKMYESDKQAIATIYQHTCALAGEMFDEQMHNLITQAQVNLDEAMKMRVYEQRLYAETMIGRPRMKTFKARLREQNIIQ